VGEALWGVRVGVAHCTNKLALRKKLGICLPSPNSLGFSFQDLSVHTDGRKDGQTDMAINPDQEHIYFMGDSDQDYIFFTGSETLPSACYTFRRI